SKPSTTASRSSSRENMRAPLPLSEGQLASMPVAAPPTRYCKEQRPGGTASLLPGLLEGHDSLARLEVLREQDDLLARGLELLKVLVDHAAVLRLQGRGHLALAIGRESDRSDDRLVLILVQVLGERLLVETLGGVDGCLDHLSHGVAE